MPQLPEQTEGLTPVMGERPFTSPTLSQPKEAMPVLDTPALDSMADAFSSPQDSSVRDSELQASAPKQPERRYPLRERKPPQRLYESLVNFSVRDFGTCPYQYITLYFYQVQQQGGKRNISICDTIPALSVYYKGSLNEKMESYTKRRPITLCIFSQNRFVSILAIIPAGCVLYNKCSQLSC